MESNPAPAEPVLGLILAGGLSSRMGGGDKTLLPLAGRPMLAHVIARLGPQVARLALSANGDPGRFKAFGLPVLPDAAPLRRGPLAGVLAGLDFAARAGFGLMATAPGDTPFLPADLVLRLRAAGAPLALAVAGGRDQPTCALWPVGLRAALRAALDAGAGGAGAGGAGAWMRAQGAAEAVFPDAEAFANVNRPEDLVRAEAQAAQAAQAARG